MNGKKLLFAASLILFFLPTSSHADTAVVEDLQTTDTVTVFVGCWNPAICSDPAAFWNALGLAVPAVEPPAEYFAPDRLLFDWRNDPPTWQTDTTGLLVTQTPEPGSIALLMVGAICLVMAKRFVQ